MNQLDQTYHFVHFDDDSFALEWDSDVFEDYGFDEVNSVLVKVSELKEFFESIIKKRGLYTAQQD